MTSSFLRAALSLSVLGGLAAGCSSGRQSRVEPAGTATATAQDIERAGSDPIEKVLQAKAPGAIVQRTAGGGISVQIRGAGSFNSSEQPLYLVDDVPVQPGPGGVLPVNPYDIETIKVLKNPEDTGLYGMRGSNGVIVITTKKPGKHRS